MGENTGMLVIVSDKVNFKNVEIAERHLTDKSNIRGETVESCEDVIEKSVSNSICSNEVRLPDNKSHINNSTGKINLKNIESACVNRPKKVCVEDVENDSIINLHPRLIKHKFSCCEDEDSPKDVEENDHDDCILSEIARHKQTDNHLTDSDSNVYGKELQNDNQNSNAKKIVFQIENEENSPQLPISSGRNVSTDLNEQYYLIMHQNQVVKKSGSANVHNQFNVDQDEEKEAINPDNLQNYPNVCQLKGAGSSDIIKSSDTDNMDQDEEEMDSNDAETNLEAYQSKVKEEIDQNVDSVNSEASHDELSPYDQSLVSESMSASSKDGQGHVRKTPYQCSYCVKKFSRKGELTRHVRVHTGERPFTCDTCNESFSQQINLITHLSVHTGEKPYTCDICLKTFSRRSYLAQHHLIHSGKRDYPCNVCHKQFYNKSDLEKHVRTHTGVKPFVCDTCGKQFTQRINLITHLNVHTGEKPFQCDLCQKNFSRRAHLTTHLLIHTGEKPFTCDICDRKFARKEHLGYHLTSHSGEKPFSCDICQMNFGLKTALKRHLVIHTGKKPFPCNECDKQFMDKGSLTIHQRSHNGEKRFSCEICNKKFYRNADVMRHLKIHSPFRQLKRKVATPSSDCAFFPLNAQTSVIFPLSMSVPKHTLFSAPSSVSTSECPIVPMPSPPSAVLPPHISTPSSDCSDISVK